MLRPGEYSNACNPWNLERSHHRIDAPRRLDSHRWLQPIRWCSFFHDCTLRSRARLGDQIRSETHTLSDENYQIQDDHDPRVAGPAGSRKIKTWQGPVRPQTEPLANRTNTIRPHHSFEPERALIGETQTASRERSEHVSSDQSNQDPMD